MHRAPKTTHDKFNQIMAMMQAGDLTGAQALLETARRIAPRDINLLNLAAWLATLQSEHPRAVALYKQVLAQNPNQPTIRFNLHRAEAIVAEQAGDLPTARNALQHAAALAPQDNAIQAQISLIERQLCSFEGTTQASAPHTPLAGRGFLSTTSPLNPAAAMVLLDDPAAQHDNALRWATQQFSAITPFPPAPHHTNTTPIRLGFLSSDLHEHATAYLIAEIFELLDHSRFTPAIYSYGIQTDTPIRQRIITACPNWHDVSQLEAKAVAQKIRDDGIDILIDLKGYTRGGRLDILAYRPAPVQMHWLGFPGTLGCPFIDYFIADPIALPPALEPYFSEKILRLPDCYQCNDRQRALPPPLPRTHYGLPEDAIIFASLNQTYKLHPTLLQHWATILHAVPKSVLWLLASNPTAPDHIRTFMAVEGITPERLFFAQPTNQHDHLQRYHAVDIALDTFSIGGHTTTSDALWLGVPVVTLAGDSFVSRVAASLLTAAQQPDLITTTPEAYQALAINLAQDTTRRTAIKTALVNNRLQLPLFDSESFVKNLMIGLECAWQRHQNNLPPESLSVERG